MKIELVKLIEESLKLHTMDDFVNWIEKVILYEKHNSNEQLSKKLQELQISIHYNLIGHLSYEFWNIMNILYDLTEIKKERMVQLITADNKSYLEYHVAICWVTQTAMLNLPMKVIVSDWSPADCPRCGAQLSTHHGDGYFTHLDYLDRCPDCGQMLKW